MDGVCRGNAEDGESLVPDRENDKFPTEGPTRGVFNARF